jgi:vacuolar-type H+-ATPase subunit C/Vma6
MIGPVRYSAANAASRAAVARLLPDSLWSRLAAARDVDAVLGLLSGTGYEPVMASAPDSLDRIEKHLRRHLVQSLQVPRPFLRGGDQRVTDWLWRRLELENITIVVRGIHGQVQPPRIRDALVPLDSFGELDWEHLSNARSIPEIVDRLGQTRQGRLYARALDNATGEYRRQRAVSVLEVAIELAYYRELKRVMKQLHGSAAADAKQLLGRTIDAENMLRAFRYRIFFGLAPELVMSYMLPGGDRVDASVVQRIATGGPVVEVVRSVWPDELPGLPRLAERSERMAAVELEVLLRRSLYDSARRALTGYTLRLRTILAYAMLINTEIRDLIALLEAKASGWSEEQTRQSLAGAGRNPAS